MLENIGAAIFVLCWIGGLVGMAWLVVERIQMFVLVSSTYERGRVVLRTSVPSAPILRAPAAVTRTASARFRFVAPKTAIFCSGRQWFQVRLNTLVPVKGTLRWCDERIQIEGRMPTSLWLFAGAWVAAAFVWSVIAAITPNGDLAWLLVGPGAFVFMWLNGPAWIPVERRRAMTAAAEVIAWCETEV